MTAPPPAKNSLRAAAALCLFLIFLGLLTVFSQQATGQNEAQNQTAVIAKVDGFLDEIVAQYIEDSIKSAESENALVLVLQVNSSHSVLSEKRFQELADAVVGSQVPVASWVGPSGGKARGRVAELVLLTNPIGIAPGASIGKTDARPGLADRTVGFDDSVTAGIADFQTPTIGDLLLQVEGFESREVKDDENCTRDCLVHLEPVTSVRFTRLSILDQVMHTVASPPVAYLLFGFGMALIVLEYYTAGIGISGVIGAIAFLLGVYGLVVLPTNLWAAALLVIGVFGFAVDIQTGVPRVWTAIGTVAYLLGSLFLYHSGVQLSWILLLVGIGGMLLGMAGALPVLVRSRFTTPTIGREWMIGETASVLEEISPSGTIGFKNAVWSAHTYRADPIEPGAEVKITGIDNLVLEVERVKEKAKRT